MQSVAFPSTAEARTGLRPVDSPHAGLYVHIPFCRTKCSYCDFNCYAGQNHLIPAYVEALRAELRLYAELGWRARTLYFGGGTPSLLQPAQVAAVVRTARSELRLGSTEVTLEANPGTVDAGYFSALLETGVNRVSVGVQSFRDSDLKPLARHHTAQEAREAFLAAREVGVPSLSLDLIYGLPRQTLAAWEHNVWEALALEPEHISLYALQIEEGTPLARQVAQGRVEPVDDDLMADMYERAHELISAAGLRRYELSSWVLPGRESQHNRIYWRNEQYIGAGAGAHGYLSGIRYSNERLPSRYIECLRTGSSSEVEREEIGPELERAETVILGLRLEEGVSDGEFRERYGRSLDSVFGSALDEMLEYGLLTRADGRIQLTDRGRLLSNEVFQRLLPD
ncbi:MAG: radical SAM family heme chaperone HemW [Chloroflexota bacterium]|nr:radical SAM family heme chaperone HemW [Chloroflexota bacterium]